MSYFLLRFSRRGGVQPSIERFEEPNDAFERLFDEERRLAGTEEEGIVLLMAEDEADLRETHAHYFESLGSLKDAVEREGETVG